MSSKMHYVHFFCFFSFWLDGRLKCFSCKKHIWEPLQWPINELIFLTWLNVFVEIFQFKHHIIFFYSVCKPAANGAWTINTASAGCWSARGEDKKESAALTSPSARLRCSIWSPLLGFQRSLTKDLRGHRTELAPPPNSCSYLHLNISVFNTRPKAAYQLPAYIQ